MRVISGKLKGRSIKFIKNHITRPIKDSVKENIFNILKHSNEIKVQVENSSILDLYSGVGSFGIECISRGAKEVTFVEENKHSFRILSDNLKNLSILSQSNIINRKIDDFQKIKKRKEYDIFFFDPPFVDNQFFKHLVFFKEEKFYNDNHIVIVHREKKSKDNLNKYLKPVKTKVYGRSMIFFGMFN